ncbi:LLM class flavin-dependent oxidoreductase [SAR202 cluster bacterium AD-804-J14_MRT_500m]|nr:LLM class flavin-dependent oxidoreductase [SAR202 cluster bacterium AD-804-J14_MRT_500m]
MDVYFFTEMPYAEFDENEADKYPSMRLTFPNTYFDPNKAHYLFQRYLDEYQYAEEMGWDGLMTNEHHNTPSCMDVEVNIISGILARITKRVPILILGNVLPTSDNPTRLAEEVAMVDVISGGRVISGIVRGIGIESWAYNINPTQNRERFEEAHDLMVKTWTTPGPFRWEGKHYHYRVINPWVLPVQKPHPPIWTPGAGSPETVEWAARHRYTYAAFLTPLDVASNLFDMYRTVASEDGWEPGPDKFSFMVTCHVDDTDEKAYEEGKHFMWRMRRPLEGPTEYFSPPGYVSRRGTVNFSAVAHPGSNRPKALSQLSYDELIESNRIIVGNPETVIKKLRHIKDTLGIGALMLESQAGKMSHESTMRHIELMGKEVIPALREN